MKNTCTILFSAALILAANVLIAAPAPIPMKIAVIDRQATFSQLEEAQKAIADMKVEESKLLDTKQKAEIDLKGKAAKYQAGASKLTEKARQEEEQKIAQEITQIQQSLSAKAAEHEKKGQEISASINSKMGHITESVAKKGGFDLVIDASAVVYKKESVPTITAEVAAAYNKAFPLVKDSKKPAQETKKADPKK